MQEILIPIILNWKEGELTFPKRDKDVMGTKVLQVKFVNKICHPPTPSCYFLPMRLVTPQGPGRRFVKVCSCDVVGL